MRLALLLPLMLLAAPAPAQIWDGGRSVETRPLRPVDPAAFQRGRETRRIDRSIREGVRRGELTRREGRELRAQARAIAGSSFGVANGVGTQQDGAVLNLRGLVDARRAEGRARASRASR
ncbi:hypothetical protein [Sphingomonas sp. VNH70]|uniref:hypothetical protein n=1 Tax=Sphingomonas silueang TaxID=3156617 RepID=UPI0032B554A4